MAKQRVFIAEFDADGKAYFKTLDQAEKRTLEASKRMKQSFDLVGSSITKLAGSLGVLAFAKDSMDKFIESQRTLEKLERAVGKLSDATKDWIDQMELSSRYGDEEIKGAMARIGAYVKEEGMLKRITEAVMDFAAAKDMDLVEASELTIKSIVSGTNALSRYGIQLDETASPLQKVNQLIEQFGIFAGEGKLQTDSQVDALIRLRKELENTQESLGENILPIWNTFLETINQIIYSVRVLSEVISGKRAFSDLWVPVDQLMQLDKWRKEKANELKSSLQGFGGFGVSSLEDAKSQVLSAIGGIVGSEPKEKKKKEKERKLPTDLGKVYMRDFEKGYLPGLMAAPDLSQMGFQMYESISNEGTKVEDLVKQWADEWAEEFNNKFNNAVDVAQRVRSIFNITADTFVGKLISGVETAAEILGLINSIGNLLNISSTVAYGAFAKGGTILNKNGAVSITGFPSFATGGSFSVPPGYSRDNYPILVKSGERVDITPTNQVPNILQLLKQINSSIQASTMTAVKRKSAPVVVNLSLDGRTLASQVISHQNSLSRAGKNFDEL
jgi:hypothetical protein